MRGCVMAGEIIAPGADYRQLAGKSTTPLQPRVINLHTMAGTLAGTESWFSGSGRAYSHIGLGGSGAFRQWQDLRFRAASDLNGNPYSISIECEDTGQHFPGWSGSNVPQFTEAQIQTLIVLLAWLCARFGLPPTAIRSSCTDQRGIGWHRFGIDPWRQSNCPRWSSSAGKACPGDRRIVQIQNRVLPALGSPPSPPSTGDWLDMFKTQAEFEEAVRKACGQAIHRKFSGRSVAYTWLQTLYDRVADLHERTPSLDENGRKTVEVLGSEHEGHPVRVGDLDPNTQQQVRMLVEATVEPVVERVLAKHGVIEPDDG